MGISERHSKKIKKGCEWMAERRMFSKSVVETDAFYELPAATQALYYHLCMNADDDGFVSNPKKIQQNLHATKKSRDLLIEKGYIIQFDSSLVAIRHWKINNRIRSDRYKETIYIQEKSLLFENKAGSYEMIREDGAHGCNLVYQTVPQYSIGKDSGGECSLVIGEETAEGGERKTNDDDATKKENLSKNDDKTTKAILVFHSGDVFHITQKDLNEWHETYPTMDLTSELKKMQEWLTNHPDKQDFSGARHYIVSWLKRAAAKENENAQRLAQWTPEYEAAFQAAIYRGEEEDGDLFSGNI